MKIDPISFVPIYEQIKLEIKNRVSVGILKPRDGLPSIRELAQELIVNPNTVARAYRDLEQEGVITTRKGKGCSVAEDSGGIVREDRAARLTRILDTAIVEGLKATGDPVELKKAFEDRLNLATKKRGSSHE